MTSDWRTDALQRRVLERIFSRGELRPKLDPARGVTYPDVDEITGSSERSKAIVEDLLAQGALASEISDRVVGCPLCRSMRVAVRQTCPECGSHLIEKHTMVQHTEYGHSGSIRNFVAGEAKCPVCNETLNEGDYRVLGTWFKCASCGETFDKPEVLYVCPADSLEFTYHEAVLVDVYSYKPSPSVKKEFEKSTEVIIPLVKALEKNGGYVVKAPGKVVGISGVTHTFDLIIEVGANPVAVDAMISNDTVGAEHVLPSIVKFLDTDLYALLIAAVPKVSEEAKTLLSSYNVGVIEGEMPSDLTSKLLRALAEVKGRSVGT